MIARLSRMREDQGVTLVELLVTMLLLSFVTSITVTSFTVMARSKTQVNDEATGLSDVRKVSERLGRDIRNARGVDAGATSSMLVLWIDTNSNYRREADESVEWRLRAIAGDPDHFDVVRVQGGASTVVQARSLVNQIAFEYDAPAPNTKVVSTTLNYDAFVGTGTTTRNLYFAERLRNVDDVT